MSIRIAALGAADRRYQVPFQEELVRLVRSFNGDKGFTARGIGPALVSARNFAEEALEQINEDRSELADELRRALGATLGTARERIRADLREAIRQLSYLSGLMAKQSGDPYVFKAPHKTWIDVRSGILAPYFAFSPYPEVMAVGRAATERLLEDLQEAVVNLPSSIVREVLTYAGDQLKKSIPSLPWWVGPVAIGGGLLVGSLYAAPFIARQIRRTRRA